MRGKRGEVEPRGAVEQEATSQEGCEKQEQEGSEEAEDRFLGGQGCRRRSEDPPCLTAFMSWWSELISRKSEVVHAHLREYGVEQPHSG